MPALRLFREPYTSGSGLGWLPNSITKPMVKRRADSALSNSDTRSATPAA